MNESQRILCDRADRTYVYQAGWPPPGELTVRYADYVALRDLAFRLLENTPIEQLSTLEIAEYLAGRVAYDERKIRENDE